MSIDLDKYLALAKKPDKTSEDVNSLVYFVSDNINKVPDKSCFLDIIGSVTGAFSLIKDEKTIDTLLRVLHELSSSFTSEKQIAYCNYQFFVSYLRLGFAPKTVEYALKIISSEVTTPTFRLAAYTELTNRAIDCAEYEKAHEYALRGIELLDSIPSDIQSIYALIIYGNLLCTLSHMGTKEELDETQAIINRIIAENPDSSDIRGLSVSINIDLAAANILSQGCSKKRVSAYEDFIFRLAREFTRNSAIGQTYFHDISGDVPVLQKMLEDGYYKECAAICSGIVENNSCFSGHIDEIYSLIEQLHSIDSTLFEEQKYEKYLNRYHDVLSKLANTNASMMRRMIREEFRIHDVNAAYESLSSKYESDSLTACYNRPSFEMNAAPFLSAHPNGSLAFIDIDGLKFTNDSLGHDAGDFLLKTFVQTSISVIDNGLEKLYRYAGDEFILVSSRQADNLLELMKKLTEAFDKPFKMDKKTISISFSYGVASFVESKADDPEERLNDIVKIADRRMYRCKHKHKKLNPETVR